MGITNPEKIY